MGREVVGMSLLRLGLGAGRRVYGSWVFGMAVGRDQKGIGMWDCEEMLGYKERLWLTMDSRTERCIFDMDIGPVLLNRAHPWNAKRQLAQNS